MKDIGIMHIVVIMVASGAVTLLIVNNRKKLGGVSAALASLALFLSSLVLAECVGIFLFGMGFHVAKEFSGFDYADKSAFPILFIFYAIVPIIAAYNTTKMFWRSARNNSKGE